MTHEQLEIQPSQIVADDVGSDGRDCQAFLSQLWQQTQQVVKAPPVTPPAPPPTRQSEQDTRARYSYD